MYGVMSNKAGHPPNLQGKSLVMLEMTNKPILFLAVFL